MLDLLVCIIIDKQFYRTKIAQLRINMQWCVHLTVIGGQRLKHLIS